ncbi:hypothetical protein BS055_RS22840 [Vibrio parahaemolyticus]|uniref:hypothetical protein n=1 Tax=Vibrio harveyi group TaxID=717610 RepID=UPI0003FC61C0|nr:MULTISPECIES: hypothetical protein [Vibrio harveyi group]EJG0875480.1 hypothetical protein [Vibrio parahaemolyticus O3]EJG0904110.1 hypothetical protein [Vibrio parahaemolyticus O3:K56]EJG1076939.1 hypothetical protein [Vibrio parahaemolyticus O1:K56]KIT30898.1 hypothetical protein H323_18155 [Vibrio parahaemolyticus VP766]EHV9709226.1 hypothetical protein [Vibrio parahaemolyticus]
MKKFISPMLILALSGCTTIHYGADTTQNHYSLPELGSVTKSFVGDHMIDQGVATTMKYLTVGNTIDGAAYDIPKGDYVQIGHNKGVDYFATSSQNNTTVSYVAGLFEPPIALSLENNKVCVTTVSYQPAQCYDNGSAKVENKTVHTGSSFRQTLIYNGSVGNKINISYREFSSGMARDAFTNNVEYDMAKSNIINYKGAVIEVQEYDNSSIKFVVKKHFRDNFSVTN